MSSDSRIGALWKWNSVPLMGNYTITYCPVKSLAASFDEFRKPVIVAREVPGM